MGVRGGLLALLCLLTAPFFSTVAGAAESGRKLMTQHCTSCHAMSGYVPADRSEKAWELTVQQMKGLATGGAHEFSDESAAAIVQFLASFGEGQELVLNESALDDAQPPAESAADQLVTLVVPTAPIAQTETPPLPECAIMTSATVERPVVITPPPAPEVVVAAEPPPPPQKSKPVVVITAPVTVAATPVANSAAVSGAGIPVKKRSLVSRAITGVKKIWHAPQRLPLPSPRAAIFAVARVMGDVSLGLLCLLILGGIFRRIFTKARFRRIHLALAGLLVVTASLHSVVYVVKYGTPNIVWFWYGLLGLALIFAVEICASIRKAMREFFFSFHKIAAVVALCVVILHWAWYYVV